MNCCSAAVPLIEKNAERRYLSSTGILCDLDACLAALEAGRALDDFVPGRHEIADRSRDVERYANV